MRWTCTARRSCSRQPTRADALLGMGLFETALRMEESPLLDAARRVLLRAASSEAAAVVRQSFQILTVLEKASHYRETVARFLDTPVRVLDTGTTAVLVEQDLSPDRLEVFVAEAEARCMFRGTNSNILDTAG